jgi:hypothetical protein
MSPSKPRELRRRSLLKALLWRVIGVVWTWVGAYIILLFIPPSRQSAALIATLIVLYHHSTRMIMYYLYERIWNAVGWGHAEIVVPMSKRQKLFWATGTALALAFIFFLLLDVHPRIKEKQSAQNKVPPVSESAPAAPSIPGTQ